MRTGILQVASKADAGGTVEEITLCSETIRLSNRVRESAEQELLDFHKGFST